MLFPRRFDCSWHVSDMAGRAGDVRSWHFSDMALCLT